MGAASSLKFAAVMSKWPVTELTYALIALLRQVAIRHKFHWIAEFLLQAIWNEVHCNNLFVVTGTARVPVVVRKNFWFYLCNED